MTLTEFLLARIAEDEAHLPEGFDCWYDPSRYAIECEAKRGAIEAAWDDHVRIEGEWGSCQSREQMSAEDDNPEVIEWLAMPYADHPDYRPKWRPRASYAL